MGILEVSQVAKSSNKPIIGIGPSEDSLNRFQQEDEISCSKFAFTSQSFTSDVEDQPKNFKDRRSLGKLQLYTSGHG